MTGTSRRAVRPHNPSGIFESESGLFQGVVSYLCLNTTGCELSLPLVVSYKRWTVREHQNQKYALWSRTYDPIDSIGRLLSITVRRNTPAEGIAHGDDDVSSSLGLMSGLSKSNPSPHLFRQGGLIPAFFFAPRLGCDQSIGQFCDLLPERMTRNHMRSVHTLPRVPLCQTPDGPAPSVE